MTKKPTPKTRSTKKKAVTKKPTPKTRSTTKKAVTKKPTPKTRSTKKKAVTKKPAKERAPRELPPGWKLPRLRREEGLGWVTTKQVPGWGDRRLEIRLEEDQGAEAPPEGQVAVLARLLTDAGDLRPAFQAAAFRYYQEVIDAEWAEEQVDPPIKVPGDIWRHFAHWSASISGSPPFEVMFEGSCSFTGHGFGAVFEDFVLTRVGDVANDCPFVVGE